MRRPQIIGLAVAGVAGIGAMIASQTMLSPATRTVVKTETVNATRVLVASRDIALGEMTNSAFFKWIDWPSEAVAPNYISYDREPNGRELMSGGVARSPITANEPITAQKLIRAGQGGVLAAILPPGKRAASTPISERSAVGKMILPNDHVDVILTQRKRSRTGAEEFVSDTLFRNIRVLAIGQMIEAREGRKDAEGNVATLELTPRQAEMLALANTMGEISLALRSIADITTMDDGSGDALKRDEGPSNAISVTRYGQTTRAFGVN
ncbi:MAG: Flp pilus assembly protein CpaB [Hyphomicrobiaceae bacterium]